MTWLASLQIAWILQILKDQHHAGLLVITWTLGKAAYLSSASL